MAVGLDPPDKDSWIRACVKDPITVKEQSDTGLHFWPHSLLCHVSFATRNAICFLFITLASIYIAKETFMQAVYVFFAVLFSKRN